MSLSHTPRLNAATHLPLLLTILFLSLIPPSHASNSKPLPLGSVLDSQGNPIQLPSKQESALEIPSIKPTKEYQSTPAKSRKRSQSRSKKSKLSRKQQLASRTSVANDPGCRWLDARMDHLERKLNDKGNSNANSYHKKELSIREQEWKCLKCGAEGPKQTDHDHCQYRR
ncbi:hypothetical protein [Shewanella woodyi]|uniref:Uncharacterized protein n=1 Tax=Shewanella woodyi (strain ATCC 51908 / MS32) TaxID=392500 RepID=B1KL82_SHEWM|nr:hypothetical protein [Shewanella woodyi]ACA84423.1 conserved hypothetical protein [Shewanella woodyi ATCC 51908]